VLQVRSGRRTSPRQNKKKLKKKKKKRRNTQLRIFFVFVFGFGICRQQEGESKREGLVIVVGWASYLQHIRADVFGGGFARRRCATPLADVARGANMVVVVGGRDGVAGEGADDAESKKGEWGGSNTLPPRGRGGRGRLKNASKLFPPPPSLDPYLFGDKYLFSILPNQQRARSDFCLILYVVNYGRVGKYIMRKSKRYLFGDKYVFYILPNQQRARFDFVRGQLWSCGKVHHAEVKEIFPFATRQRLQKGCGRKMMRRNRPIPSPHPPLPPPPNTPR
jgi:hypothetical protein